MCRSEKHARQSLPTVGQFTQHCCHIGSTGRPDAKTLVTDLRKGRSAANNRETDARSALPDRRDRLGDHSDRPREHSTNQGDHSDHLPADSNRLPAHSNRPPAHSNRPPDHSDRPPDHPDDPADHPDDPADLFDLRADGSTRFRDPPTLGTANPTNWKPGATRRQIKHCPARRSGAG